MTLAGCHGKSLQQKVAFAGQDATTGVLQNLAAGMQRLSPSLEVVHVVILSVAENQQVQIEKTVSSTVSVGTAQTGQCLSRPMPMAWLLTAAYDVQRFSLVQHSSCTHHTQTARQSFHA